MDSGRYLSLALTPAAPSRCVGRPLVVTTYTRQESSKGVGEPGQRAAPTSQDLRCPSSTEGTRISARALCTKARISAMMANLWGTPQPQFPSLHPNSRFPVLESCTGV